MDHLIADVRRCVKDGLYLPALLALMNIPEGCAAIEFPTIDANGARFRRWYEAYVVHQNNLSGNMAATIAWKIRNGLVHELSVKDQGTGEFVRVAFILPTSQLVMHMGKLKLPTGTWLPIYLAAYVEEILTACERWLESARQDTRKATAIAELIGYKELPVRAAIVGDNFAAIF